MRTVGPRQIKPIFQSLHLKVIPPVTKYILGLQSELLGQFRLIGDRASDVSGGRICLTQNAYAEI